MCVLSWVVNDKNVTALYSYGCIMHKRIKNTKVKTHNGDYRIIGATACEILPEHKNLKICGGVCI